MNRDEAITTLKEMHDSFDEIHENTNGEIGYEQMTAIDMAIEALSAEAVQGWIPCSERLPEVGEICLLTVHEYGWNCKDYIRVIIGKYSDNYADHILAWMPLPDPYTEMEP